MSRSPHKARVLLDNERTISAISPLLFGGFSEHMGRCVYGGLYEPGSPLADERGFRRDVQAALREMRMSILRYPGGNMLSGYNWLDVVARKYQRLRRREMAGQSIETDKLATNELVENFRVTDRYPILTFE